ncbi:MAG: Multiple antibiotic resistance protein MarA [Burkholderia gladioli]|nr:MAG: Multiple antibiotic resistance protein MarA [Burkholderia gladioli]
MAGLPDARGTTDYAAARRARDYLREHGTRPLKLEEVEAATGRDRWSLSHDFRTFYGTSPYRYLTMRRLDVARRLLIAGEPLSSAAIGAGFADQAHMTRQFAQAFGITPGRWRHMTAARPRG